MCWLNARRKIMSIISDRQYDKIYLLFRTNRVSLSKSNTQYVTGYYDVDLDNVNIDPDYEEPVIYAKEARFVDLKSAIDLSGFLKESHNQRFPFSTETKRGSFRKHLNNWVEKIRKSQNFLDDYINITKMLDKLFKYYEFEEGIYPMCNDCIDTDECHLIKRIHGKGKLYHQLHACIKVLISR